MNRLLIVGAIVVLLLAGFLGYGVAYIGGEQYRFEGLLNFGVQADGFIAAKQESSGRLIYSFDVDGVRYSGYRGGGKQEFERLRLGDRVVVTYDPSDPNESFLGDVSSVVARNNLLIGRVAILFSLIGFMTYLAIIVLWKLLKRPAG